MIRHRFQQKIVSGRFTLLVAIVLSALIWIMDWGSEPSGMLSTFNPLGQKLLSLFSVNLIGEFINFFVYGLLAYLLVELNNAYSLIRVKTTFQCTIFVLLISTCPFLYSLQAGSLASLCLLAGIYFLFRSYQKQEPVGCMFHCFLFVGIGTLLFPGLFFCIPLFLIGAFNFKSLSFRTFFAGILGLSLPYWFLFGYAYFYDRMDLFYGPFLQLVCIVPIDYANLELNKILSGALSFLFFIIATIHFWLTGYQDKIRTRAFLNFVVLITIWTVLFVFLQPQHVSFLFPVLLIGSCVLIGHFFAVTSGKLSNIFFILFLTLLLGLILYNLWTI